MVRLTTTRLIAVLTACTAFAALVGSVRSADDGILTVARLEPAASPSAEATSPDARPAETAPPVAMEAPPLDPPQGPLADRLAPLPTHPDQKQIRAVLDLYRAGELSAGDRAAASLEDPAARTLAAWAAIRLLPREAGFERIQAFLRGAPEWPTQSQLRRRAEEALLGERRGTAALAPYFTSNPPVTARGKLAWARIQAERGHAAEAAALIRRAWREDDFSADIEDDVLDAFPKVLTPADHAVRAERFIAGEDWSDALRCAARAGSDTVKLVRARIAAARAASDMEALVEAVPKALQARPSYILAKAQVLRRKDKPVEAAKLLRGVSRDPAVLVSPEEWWTERRVLARKLLDQGEQRLAYEVAAGAPRAMGASGIESDFHAGWIALRFLSEPVTAADHFASAAAKATTPISISRSAYWLGRAQEAQGVPAIAAYERAAIHATTYYGQLAANRLGRRTLTLKGADVLPGAEGPLTRAVRLLLAAGARDLAVPLLADAGQRHGDLADVAAMADAVAEADDVRALLVVGKAGLQRGLPLDRHAFPVTGVPLDMLPADSVETPLVYAIARQESAFDPRAQSTAGARGLMQLMPATAKETASRARMDFALERLTSDPAYNAALGASHLGDLVDAWRGSYVLTIAAYNAGSGNVKKWVEAYGDPRNSAIDPVDWVERIPFSETRNYVQRVMENLQVYRVRLGTRSAMLIDEDLRRGASPTTAVVP